MLTRKHCLPVYNMFLRLFHCLNTFLNGPDYIFDSFNQKPTKLCQMITVIYLWCKTLIISPSFLSLYGDFCPGTQPSVKLAILRQRKMFIETFRVLNHTVKNTARLLTAYRGCYARLLKGTIM